MGDLESIITRFKDKRIVVIGDVILDKYLEGEVLRISPEAPVPVVSLKRDFYEVGGAANVSSNISSLGGQSTLFGFVGKDDSANKIRELLEKSSARYFLEENKITTEKTRVMGGNQQLIRFDMEETNKKTFSEKVKGIILDESDCAEIILISDYAKGAVTEDLMDFLSPYRKKIIVDPKPKNKELYRGVSLITPNEKECIEMSNCTDIEEGGNILKKELDSHILVTRGDRGMTIFSDKVFNIPTYAKAVYDVTGAGDSAVAALALAISAGAGIYEAAMIANHAAGIAVEKKGTYKVRIEELRERILNHLEDNNATHREFLRKEL